MKKRLLFLLSACMLLLALAPLAAANAEEGFVVNEACGTYLGQNSSGVYEFEITIPDDKTPQPRPFTNIVQYKGTSYDGDIVGMSFNADDRFKFYGIKPGKCDFKAATGLPEEYNIVVHITVVPADTYYGDTTAKPGADESGTQNSGTQNPGTQNPGTQEHPNNWQDKTEPATGEHISGNLAMAKLSQKEIIQLLKNNPNTLPEQNIFEVVPSCSAPYSIGKVKDSVLEATVNRLNALRRLAGLPDARLDEDFCEEAQYGAVIMVANNKMSHYPQKPADMSESFYKKAYAACSSSNIYSGGALPSRIDGWMNDSDSSNVAAVGHRRWQLSPTLTRVGFGTADRNGGNSGPSAERVVDTYNNKADFDYDFIGWPASGNFPGDLASLMNYGTAWSVSLNPEKYATPDINSVKVTLTRQSDGKKWTFAKNNYTAANSGLYYNISMYGMGEGTCIIFRPDAISAGETYSGDYTVRIDGLKTKSGKAVNDFEYEVNFFDTDISYAEKPVAPQPGTQQTGGQQTATGADTSKQIFADVTKYHWAYTAVQSAYADGVIKGDGYNSKGQLIFAPARTLTMAEFVAIVTRGFYAAEISTENNTNLWYTPNLNVANQHKLLGGLDNVDMNKPVSRYQMAQIMLNILHDKGINNPADNLLNQTIRGIADWNKVGSAYQESVSVCYNLGLLKGSDSTGAFKGSDTMLRCECATVYLRLKDYLGENK